MADIQPTETSAAPVVAAASNDSDLSTRGGQEVPPGGNGAVKEEGRGEKEKEKGKAGTTDASVGVKAVDSSQTDGEDKDHKAVENGSKEGASSSSATMQTNSKGQVADGKADHDGGNAAAERSSPQAQTSSTTQNTSSSSTTQSHSAAPTTTHAPPLKRFTSVNITKRFLEKTPSQSGTPLGGGSSSSLSGGLGGSSASAQRRGISPSSRSPSTDRPSSLSSRLVTAKLTAVPQPSTSTAGWLRPSSQTPGNSAGPTPPSTSPQPTPHDLQSTMKRRLGESPVLNGSSSLSGTTSPGSKPVWGKVATPSLGRSPTVSDNAEDFPTAAEAVHGRKQQPSKPPVETEAAQKARDALNETADAFRGVHLDANAKHWDEMEDDEDNDFLNGVIEFGDGRQYKVEQRTAEEPKSLLPEPETQEPVRKEERFGRDIGREWPKGPNRSPTDGSVHSPLESVSPTSRVLFNERSNRLEPWSSGKPPFPSRQQGPSHPPPGREGPPSNVQVLQKGSSTESVWKTGPPRGFNHMPDSRRWDGPPPPHPPPGRPDDRSWDRRRRESMSSTAASSVRDHSRGRDTHWGDYAEHDRERDRGRRNSNVGPPPGPGVPMLPPSLARDRDNYRDRGQENGRHPPLHLRMPPPMPPTRGPSGRDRDTHPHPVPTSPTMSVRSMRSLVSEKVATSPSQPVEPPLPEVDKDALVKDAMHLAVERARRRKQEGEEEEKRRQEAAERARKKAEEIAAKLEQQKKEEERNKAEEEAALEAKKRDEAEKAALEEKRKAEAEEAARRTKEEAERAAAEKSRAALLAEQKRVEEAKPSSKPPYFGDSTRPEFHGGRQPSGLSRRPIDNSPAAQAESWRSKAAPISGPPPAIYKAPTKFSPSSKPPEQPSAPPPPPMEFPVMDLSIKPGEEVEVVDFADMEKLVSPTEAPAPVPPPRAPEPAPESTVRSRRPVASDFFGDSLESHNTKTEELSWRRVGSKSVVPSPPDELRTQSMPIFTTEEPVSVSKPTEHKTPVSPLKSESVSPSQQAQGTNALTATRSPRVSQFKEAPMSTLTDTMSRIKGALDGMQSQEQAARAQPKDQKPEPRSLFGKSNADAMNGSWRVKRETVTQEVVKSMPTKSVPQPAPKPIPKEPLISRSPPPELPRPVWNTFTVRIPKVIVVREPLTKKQQHLFNLPHPGVRWDILSWDPPVEGMTKRDLSRDEIFHRKNSFKGGTGKLRVALPSRRLDVKESVEPSCAGEQLATAGMKVKLPSVPPAIRPTEQTAAPSSSNIPLWRKSAMSITPKTEQPPATPADGELNTRSRSPLPDPLTSASVQPIAKSATSSPDHPASVSLPGSVSRLTTRRSLQDVTPFNSSTQTDVQRSMFMSNKSSNEQLNGVRADTSPSTLADSTWGKSPLGLSVKESPSRHAPDPEHLKAVWSQSAGQPTRTTSNSLKGITDEMPSIPFNVNDLKSEDGGTPPPTAPAPAPSRLSLQEVTRAFQQVPDSPAGSSRAPTYGPPPTVPQVHRPNQPVAITLPPGPQFRPTYAPYPHPMVAHSPGQTMVYAPGMASPAVHPRMPVNAATPMPHGMWVPAPQGPPSQPGGFMRPGVQGPQPIIYAAPAALPPGAPGRMVPRGISVGQPGASPAMYAPMPMDMQNAMQARSPHLAHAAPVGVPMAPMHVTPMFSPQPGQPHPMYVPVGAGRGAIMPRPGYEGYPQMAHPTNGYQPMPNASFMFQQS